MNIGVDEMAESLIELADKAWAEHKSSGIEPFMECQECVKELGKEKAPVWPKIYKVCPKHGIALISKVPEKISGISNNY